MIRTPSQENALFTRVIEACTAHKWCIPTLTLLVLCPAVGPTWAEDCIPPLGNGNICTANDFQLEFMEIVSGPSGCTEGESVALTVRFALVPTANQRYDIGIFVGDLGSDPIGGSSCTFQSLTPLEPPFLPLSGTGPYRNLDGDLCGDAAKSDGLFYRDVDLTSVLCRDSDGDGLLDIDFSITWKTQGSSDCPDPLDSTAFYPDQTSRCQLTYDADLEIPVEPAPGLRVEKFATPIFLTPPAETVTFRVFMINPSSASDVVTVTELLDDVHGDLNGMGTCSVPQELAPGEYYFCSFSALIAGQFGDSETDTVTASGVDNEGSQISDFDQATVVFAAPEPGIEVEKVATPDSIPEPRGGVTYRVVIENTSNWGSVTITSLVDDPYGNLTGEVVCLPYGPPPFVLPVDEIAECSFTRTVTGQPGEMFPDEVTVSGIHQVGTVLEDMATAQVVITDRGSSIEVSKTASPAEVMEPGGTVTFTVAVQNTSGTDDVTLETITDNVHGDLNGQGTCTVPQVLAPGEVYICSFQATVSGTADDVEVDTATVTGLDDDGIAVSGRASAAVSIVVDPSSSISVTKTADPLMVVEPGDDVDFTVSVQNTSASRVVTLLSLVDNQHGDLDGQGSCAVPQILAPGDVYDCGFTATVAGDPIYVEVDSVTAEGVDDLGSPVSDFDSAAVVLLGLPASIEVEKAATPTVVTIPGGDVTFSVVVNNTSAVDTVTLDSMVDNVFGDLNGQGDCSVPQVLPPGSTYTCSFVAFVGGDAGDIHGDIVTVSAASDDDEALSDAAGAFVIIADVPVELQRFTVE